VPPHDVPQPRPLPVQARFAPARLRRLLLVLSIVFLLLLCYPFRHLSVNTAAVAAGFPVFQTARPSRFLRRLRRALDRSPRCLCRRRSNPFRGSVAVAVVLLLLLLLSSRRPRPRRARRLR
ncbi:unnamed protein product, partial [Ectocarpus fasciculatus]